MFIFKKNGFKKGFSLMEIVLVTIILVILVGLAVPRYEGVIERARAAEAVKILKSLVDAQERYNLETNLWANNVNLLDIAIPAPESFNAPTVNNLCSDTIWCARIARNIAGSYSLTMDRDGDIVCANGGSNPTCARAGY